MLTVRGKEKQIARMLKIIASMLNPKFPKFIDILLQCNYIFILYSFIIDKTNMVIINNIDDAISMHK